MRDLVRLAATANRSGAFEHDVRVALGNLEETGEIWLTRYDEALIGRR